MFRRFSVFGVFVCAGCLTQTPSPNKDRVGKVVIGGSTPSGDRVIARSMERTEPKAGMTRKEIEELLGEAPASSTSWGVYGRGDSSYYFRSGIRVRYDGDDRALEVSLPSKGSKPGPVEHEPKNALAPFAGNEINWSGKRFEVPPTRE